MKFYDEIISKLKDKEPFKFSRWGDGEWLCMQGEDGVNRDNNRYLPELGKELIKIINSKPDYYIGIQYGVFYNEKYVLGTRHPSLREFMISTLFRTNLNTVNGDVLHQASEFGHLREFTDALKGRNVVVIGADYFSALPYRHIEIPGFDSYYSNQEIFRQIENDDMTGYNDDPVYLVAAAMNSNVIIDRLEGTAIDIGSVFDPYMNICRATYQYDLKITDWLW